MNKYVQMMNLTTVNQPLIARGVFQLNASKTIYQLSVVPF